MKFFLCILSLSALIGFTVTAYSEANKSHGSTQARLLTFEVSKNWKDLFDSERGKLQIDFSKKEVTLVLSQAKRDSVIVTLPIVDVRNDLCNIRVIEARRDRRELDGPVETMLIQDYTGYNCQHTSELPSTRISYTEEGGWSPALYTAEFTAEALR